MKNCFMSLTHCITYNDVFADINNKYLLIVYDFSIVAYVTDEYPFTHLTICTITLLNIVMHYHELLEFETIFLLS